MRKVSSKVQLIILLTSLVCCTCYLSIHIHPSVSSFLVFLSYLTPGAIIINILLVLLLLSLRMVSAIFPIISLLMGYSLTPSVWAQNFSDETDYDFNVISFNSKFFRKPDTYNAFSIPMIDWAVHENSDIKCIQEYSTNCNWKVLDVTQKMKSAGYHTFTYSSLDPVLDHSNGLAIFSKKPIIKTEKVLTDSMSNNGIICADILIEKDTLRIYNIHLESMHLSEKKIYELWKTMQDGAIKRHEQLNILLEHVSTSPYPFILCGDFNDTPYSFNYLTLSDRFKNSFKESGNGFGFTYRRIPLLRIDHQFYSSEITSVHHLVDHKMNLSDHFPVKSWYRMK